MTKNDKSMLRTSIRSKNDCNAQDLELEGGALNANQSINHKKDYKRNVIDDPFDFSSDKYKLTERKIN